MAVVSKAGADSAVIARWRDFVATVRDRLGMYLVHDDDYDEACVLLVGFDLGLGGSTLTRFHEWLCARAPDRPELAFPAQVLREAVGATTPPVDEDQERRATSRLFDLLSDFLDDDGFERRWAAANEHLSRAAALLDLRQDSRKIVQDHLARGALIQAFQWLVLHAKRTDEPWAPGVDHSLRRAAECLGQEKWPAFVNALARQADE